VAINREFSPVIATSNKVSTKNAMFADNFIKVLALFPYFFGATSER
jgi:hypothetical protein